MDTTPESNPAHPKHHSWLAALANAAIGTGALIVTGGKLQIGPDSASFDSDPTRHDERPLTLNEKLNQKENQ